MKITILKLVILCWLLWSASNYAKEKTFGIYDQQILRVCSSANNLPFSNNKLEGFENKIATLIAEKLQRKNIEYYWHPIGMGFVRNTLRENMCDLLISTTLKNSLLLNTNPYYKSSYVLVYRKDLGINIAGLYDRNLKYLRIGISNNTPPLSVLLESNFAEQLHYYPLLVDNRHYSVGETMINDLLAKKIDVAVLWGPIAGFYIMQNPQQLDLTVIKNIKMHFKISIGVRNGEVEFKKLLNRILRKNKTAIEAILTDYNVPLIF